MIRISLKTNTAAISQFTNVEGELHIVIPPEVNGFTVTAVKEGIFKEHSELVSVTVPDTVTSVGEEAFNRNTVLIVSKSA